MIIPASARDGNDNECSEQREDHNSQISHFSSPVTQHRRQVAAAEAAGEQTLWKVQGRTLTASMPADKAVYSLSLTAVPYTKSSAALPTTLVVM